MKDKLKELLDELVEWNHTADLLSKSPNPMLPKEAWMGQVSLLYVVIPKLKAIVNEQDNAVNISGTVKIPSDEEIFEGALTYLKEVGSVEGRHIIHHDFTAGAKWYKSQIEQSLNKKNE